jgi:hypothetical protein
MCNYGTLGKKKTDGNVCDLHLGEILLTQEGEIIFHKRKKSVSYAFGLPNNLLKLGEDIL